jgi:uncharacterized membrane protein
MAIQAEVVIDAPKEDVWKVITDIKNSAKYISGINKVEVLEDPEDGLVGFKWEETRTMFGQTATEIMWITDLEENQYYRTRAERPNIIYISTLTVEDKDQSTHLTMGFEAEPLSLGSKILSAITGVFFNKATRNALQQDLEDIKAYVEGS